MLNFLRRSATSVFAWIILGILAVVFGLSFGLPSDSLTLGTSSLLEVHGTSIADPEYRLQYNLVRRTLPIPKDPRYRQLIGLKEEVLAAAVEREVLASEADDLGLAATDQDAEDLVGNGHMIVMGDAFDWLGDYNFDYQLFTNSFLRSLQTSEAIYLETQRREWLARTVRDVIEASVVVPEPELRRLYDRTANRMSLRYARFLHADFAALVDPSEAEVDAWVADHEADLVTRFEESGTRFLKLPKQVRVRVIRREKDPEAHSSEPPTELETALEEIRGGADMRSIARRVSDHPSSRAGGDLGWSSEKIGTGLDPAVDQALPDLEVGAVSEPLEGEDAWFVVQVIGRREGDTPQPQAIRELAEEAVALERGKAMAQDAAQAALDAVSSGTPLESAFLPAGETPAPDDRRGTLRETGMFSMADPIPVLGRVPELTQAAWDAEEGTPLLPEVFELPDAAVVAGRVSKETSTDEGYEQARPDIYAREVRTKGVEVAGHWARHRCEDARARGSITVSEDRVERVLTYQIPGEDDPTPKPGFDVCDRVGGRGGLLRSSLLRGMGG